MAGNKRPKKPYRRRAVFAPTLVALHSAPEVEITELMAIELLSSGLADQRHFNLLLDITDKLLMAAHKKQEQGVVELCHAARLALSNIKDRYLERKVIRATGEELKAMRALVDVNTDFWKRQGGGVFVAAENALDRLREAQRAAM